MNRREHCRRQFCPDLGAVKSWPKRYHPRGHFPGPLAYRGLGRELEQAAPWALCRIFEQSHRLGWAGHQKETEPLALSQVMECQLDWFFSSSTRDPPCLLGVVSFQAQPLPSLGPHSKGRGASFTLGALSSPLHAPVGLLHGGDGTGPSSSQHSSLNKGSTSLSPTSTFPRLSPYLYCLLRSPRPVPI